MKSEKINLKKKFIIIWIMLIIILSISILTTIAPYNKYKKGQDLAVASMLIATNEFKEYKDNKKELLNKLYDYFNKERVDIKTRYGTFDRSAERESIRKVEETLSEILEKKGYDEFYSDEASRYFKYTNFLSYYLYKQHVLIVLFGILCSMFLLINILYILSRKVVITVNDNMIIYKKITGKSKEFMIKDITSAETTILKGLKITGNGIKVKTLLLSNNDKLKDYIMSLIPKSTGTNLSMADELEKYKKLLDSKAITKKEYEQKKKELLNL